jgi:TusA-related sulfurtransferase
MLNVTFAILLQAAAPAPAPGGMGPNHMQHCPNAVEGAKTSIKNTKDGVEITVTAKDENAVQEIRKRASHLSEVAAKPETGKDTGGGDFGGGKGHCPVIMKDTTVTAADAKGGSKITVKMEKGKGDVKALQKMVKERQASMPKAEPAKKSAAPAEKKSAAPAEKKPDKATAEKKPAEKAAAGGGW